MSIYEKAKEYDKKISSLDSLDLIDTDPDFMEIFNNFVLDEVINQNDLDEKTRFIAILSALIGCQGIDEYKIMLLSAPEAQITPIEIKEIVYQGAAYLGIGRVLPFLKATNEILRERGIELPLESQSTTTKENRR